MLETIALSLGAVASVTTILRNLQGGTNDDLRLTIDDVSQRVRTLETRVSQTSLTSSDQTTLLESYNTLLEVLRRSRHYSGRLEFRPTANGTWMLIRKKKSVILRDPDGEYGSGSRVGPRHQIEMV